MHVSNKGILNLCLQKLKEEMEAEFYFFTTFNAMNPPNNKYVGDYTKVGASRAEVGVIMIPK